MDRIVFAAFNTSRRPEFQLKTLATKDNRGNISFSKTCFGEGSEKVLEGMSKLQTEIQKVAPSVKVGKSTLKDKSTLNMAYIPGIDLEHRLLDAVIANNHESVEKLLSIYDNLLDALSSSVKPPHRYRNDVFGPAFYKKFTKSTMVQPGLLDLMFDNIIISNSKPIIIDYEWSFDHDLPRDYIVARALLWFGQRHAQLFKLHSRRINVIKLADNIYRPEAILTRYKHIHYAFKATLEIEWRYFQPWVSGKQAGALNTPSLDESYVNSADQPIFALDELESMSHELMDAINQVHEYERIIGNLRQDLEAITNTTYYKAGRRAFRMLKKVSSRNKSS